MSSTSTVSQCAAGCTYPTCIGVVFKRRGTGQDYCNTKNSSCQHQETLDYIQNNGVDQYTCYSGKNIDIIIIFNIIVSLNIEDKIKAIENNS